MNVFLYSQPMLILGSALLGLVFGYSDIAFINDTAHVIAEIFMRILKLLSLPVITFAILSTLSGLGNWEELQKLGLKVVKYTLLTTVISATIAAILFSLFMPQITAMSDVCEVLPQNMNCTYLSHLLNLIPDNIIKPFAEQNVVGVLLVALFFGLGILGLKQEKRQYLHHFFGGIFDAIMVIISWVVLLMPLAVFAFVLEFVKEMQKGLKISQLFVYISIVVGANLIQAFIVLPLLLKSKGINIIDSFKGMFKALYFSFFAKSSTAAMPLAIECSERLGVSPKISRFSFPLCTTINMNACAAFIYITVLFVATSHGVVFSPLEKIVYIFVATIAAVGNAGVPMGCFFLASSLLSAMGIPLTLMGVILPVYALIDMVETAINIWSDSCVTLIVDRDVNIEKSS